MFRVVLSLFELKHVVAISVVLDEYFWVSFF
jgi:hypothetical protein